MTSAKLPHSTVTDALIHVKEFLSDAGWKHIPPVQIEFFTEPKNYLGQYQENSQFQGAGIISLNLDAISSFAVTKPYEAVICTILHEFGHMAHELAKNHLDYPEFGEYFADEEDMCEWLGWTIVMSDDLTKHPYFSRWIKVVDDCYDEHY